MIGLLDLVHIMVSPLLSDLDAACKGGSEGRHQKTTQGAAPPTVVVLVDASGSMAQTHQARWETLRSQLAKRIDAAAETSLGTVDAAGSLVDSLAADAMLDVIALLTDIEADAAVAADELPPTLVGSFLAQLDALSSLCNLFVECTENNSWRDLAKLYKSRSSALTTGEHAGAVEPAPADMAGLAFESPPKDVADALRSVGALPNLAGYQVLSVGLGNGTARTPSRRTTGRSSTSLRMVMQADGNFVVYSGDKPIWASQGVIGTAVLSIEMTHDQLNGDMVLYSGERIVWASAGKAPAFLIEPADSGHQAVLDGQHRLAAASAVARMTVGPAGEVGVFDAEGGQIWAETRMDAGLVLATSRHFIVRCNGTTVWDSTAAPRLSSAMGDSQLAHGFGHTAINIGPVVALRQRSFSNDPAMEVLTALHRNLVDEMDRDIRAGATRHHRVRPVVRLVPAVVTLLDAVVLFSFFASTFGAGATIAAWVLAVLGGAVSYAGLTTAGIRLRSFRARSGQIRWQVTDWATRFLVGVATTLVVAFGALTYEEVGRQAAESFGLSPGSGPLFTLSIALAGLTAVANTAAIAARAFDGSALGAAARNARRAIWAAERRRARLRARAMRRALRIDPLVNSFDEGLLPYDGAVAPKDSDHRSSRVRRKPDRVPAEKDAGVPPGLWTRAEPTLLVRDR